MAPPPSRALLAVAAAVLLLLTAAAQAPHDDEAGHDGAAMACTAEGCAGGARRELGGNGYISYDAMRSNSVPCSYRGASYYNCRPGGSSNPYARGCSAISQCRG